MLSITLLMTLATLKSNGQHPDFIALITAATQAPSGHNSQPWFFTIEDNRIVITPDFTKALPAVDGKHRELFMSLGCALENLCIKATELHYLTEVQLTDEGLLPCYCRKKKMFCRVLWLPLSLNDKPTAQFTTASKSTLICSKVWWQKVFPLKK